MNVIRQYFENLHPNNHLRLRGGFRLEADIENNGEGGITLRWGDQYGLHFIEVSFDDTWRTYLYDRLCDDNNRDWFPGGHNEHSTQ